MKRFLVSLAVFILLAGLLTAGGGVPIRAEDPELQRGIPRHRVGHRAKVQDLDTLLAQDDGGDPLAGNYRLVEEDEILLALRDSYGTITKWQAYDVDHNLGAPGLINEGYAAGDKPAAATGHFTGDDLDDFVVVWTDGYKVKMEVGYLRDGLYDTTYVLDTGEKHYAGYPPRVATGDYDEDGQDEIVLAWLGGDSWANLKVYDPQGSIHPSAEGKLYDEKVANGNLDVATGDFDGNGNDEVVLAWEDLGNWLSIKVYEVDHDGNLSPKAKWKGDGGRTVAVTTGDFNGDGRDEIAAVDGEHLRIWQVAQDLSTLTSKSKQSWNCSSTTDYSVIPVNVAAGDFNTDGMDEIVSTCHTGSSVFVYVWALGSGLGLSHKASWSQSVNYTREGSLAVGDLNRDLRAEIVLAWAQWDDLWYPTQQHNYVQILQVATDLGSITAKGQGDLEEAPPKTHLAAAVGDLDADSIRVGPPTYSSVVEAKQLLAVINEPPKHYDVIGGTTYDVNNNPNTYASYENSQRQSTEMSLTTTRDWGISTDLEAEAWGINASLKTSYGENFENTTSSFKEMAFGQNVWASSDDVIIRTETDFDVWEYPVYSDTAGTVQGHIAVVFPRKLDSNCKSDCKTSTTVARIDGRSPLSYYAPNHENANLLSYSEDPPGDIGTDIKSASRNYLGSNPYEFWVEWTDVESEEAKKSRQLDVSIGAGVEHWGIKAEVEGTYSKGEVSTQKVSFEQTTSIHLYFDAITQTYSYRVDPYVYWSSDDGHLVVDYAALPLTATPPTWWQNTYNQPDPTFNLPWKYNPPSEDYRLLSKEITFEPDSPTWGQQVTIQAKVRNYSLVGAYDVNVRFYRGDPDGDGEQIGSDQLIPQLNPLSSHTVSMQFQAPAPQSQDGYVKIYAVVDPEDSIEEMHEDNNKAYAILPVVPSEVLPPGLFNLVITPEDIAFDPEVPALGETVHISATIHALGKHFTFVPVEFWDGDPCRGGELIGGEVIPIILADRTATAHVTWDTTGQYGAHDMWVNIDHQAGEEHISTDNWTYKTINLPPFCLYLPLTQKDTQ
jgi:hypothetical protein